MKLPFLLAFLFLFKGVCSQNFTLICNSLYHSKGLYDTVKFEIQNPLGEDAYEEGTFYKVKEFKYKKKENKNVSTTVYKVSGDTTCAFIADLGGHEIFILPNDTMEINIRIKPFSDSFRLNHKFISPWIIDIEYINKNKFIYSLFDSIAFKAGAVHQDFVSLSAVYGDYQKMYDSIKNLHNVRLSYLVDYCKRYKLPGTIETLAKEEIDNAYLMNLISAYEPGTTNQDEYFAPLNKEQLNDSFYFFHTSWYRNLIINNEKFVKNNFDRINPDYRKIFENTYFSIKKHYSGKMRDYLLARNIKDYSSNDLPGFDSVIMDYKTFCKDKNCLTLVDSLYRIYKGKIRVSIEEALETSVQDLQDKQNRVKQIFTGRPVLIDCWASWCVPCIAQFPYSKELEEEYKDKIDFVFLSFDKDKLKWQKKTASLRLTNNSFLIKENFKSDFANYFNILSIPRYILFDKNGKLIAAVAPRPSHKENLKKLLEKTLKIN